MYLQFLMTFIKIRNMLKNIFEFASRFVQNAIQTHLEKLLSKANGSK